MKMIFKKETNEVILDSMVMNAKLPSVELRGTISNLTRDLDFDFWNYDSVEFDFDVTNQDFNIVNGFISILKNRFKGQKLQYNRIPENFKSTFIKEVLIVNSFLVQCGMTNDSYFENHKENIHVERVLCNYFSTMKVFKMLRDIFGEDKWVFVDTKASFDTKLEDVLFMDQRFVWYKGGNNNDR